MMSSYGCIRNLTTKRVSCRVLYNAGKDGQKQELEESGERKPQPETSKSMPLGLVISLPLPFCSLVSFKQLGVGD
jgi:hypothetical protein